MVNYEPSPFMPLVQAWLSLIQEAERFKQQRFGAEAAEGLRFYSGPYNFFFNSGEPDKYFHVPNDRVADGSIVVTVNKVAEMVQLFGPTIYHQNPSRQFSVMTPPMIDPMALGMAMDPASMMLYQQSLQMAQVDKVMGDARCSLLDAYLNFTPNKLRFEQHGRMAAVETLITGASCLWTEPVLADGGGYKMVGSFWDSIKNLVFDPDTQTYQNAKWIARYCEHPVWQVEKDYGLPPGYLDGTTSSSAQQEMSKAFGRGPLETSTDANRDLIGYWQVFSKMGVGGRLKDVRNINSDLRAFCELFGDFCFLAIAPGCPHPLNCPPWVYKGEGDIGAGRRAMQWKTPYWADADWPCEMTSFHSIPGDPWPLSHLSPGLGELKFLNWVYSKIVNKIRVTSRELLAFPEDMDTQLQEWLTSGLDLELVAYKSGMNKSPKELIEFIQHPQWNPDIWKVLDVVAAAFDKRVGLTELMYGLTDTQSRSATDANAKAAGVSIRPEDMANKFEASMSAVARREMFAAAWHLTPQDVLPIIQPLGAAAWGKLIYATDPREIMFKLKARVEAGTARKPNVQLFQANMQAALNQLFPLLMQYAMTTGNVSPLNALITDWGKSIQLPNIERYLIPPPPMPNPAVEPAKPKSAA